MGRGRLSEVEMKILKENPYVVSVTADRVVYSDKFKRHFVEQYFKGKKPGEIFKSAGFDVNILGSKRIERACARWKESFSAGTLGMYNDTSVVHAENSEGNDIGQKNIDNGTEDNVEYENIKLMQKMISEQKNVIVELQSKVEKLRAENDRLRKAIK